MSPGFLKPRPVKRTDSRNRLIEEKRSREQLQQDFQIKRLSKPPKTQEQLQLDNTLDRSESEILQEFAVTEGKQSKLSTAVVSATKTTTDR